MTTKVPASALQCMPAAWFDLWGSRITKLRSNPLHHHRTVSSSYLQNVELRIFCQKTDYGCVFFSPGVIVSTKWSSWKALTKFQAPIYKNMDRSRMRIYFVFFLLFCLFFSFPQGWSFRPSGPRMPWDGSF